MTFEQLLNNAGFNFKKIYQSLDPTKILYPNDINEWLQIVKDNYVEDNLKEKYGLKSNDWIDFVDRCRDLYMDLQEEPFLFSVYEEADKDDDYPVDSYTIEKIDEKSCKATFYYCTFDLDGGNGIRTFPNLTYQYIDGIEYDNLMLDSVKKVGCLRAKRSGSGDDETIDEGCDVEIYEVIYKVDDFLTEQEYSVKRKLEILYFSKIKESTNYGLKG